jgi:hypothetical protein
MKFDAQGRLVAGAPSSTPLPSDYDLDGDDNYAGVEE